MEVDRSTDVALPVPRDALLELGLTDEDIAGALERAPQVRGFCPEEHPEATFDVDRVRKAVAALRALRHTKTRRWAGAPLDPEPWQLVWIIAPVFGWVDAQGLRIIRELYVEIPRKNGKTTISTGLAIVLLCADGEPGAEVYSAAVDRSGAARILDDAKTMVRKSPVLLQRVGAKNLQAGLIRYPATNGIFRPLSKVAEAAHGLNVHGGVIDELHVHKNRDLVDAIVTGTGSRDQPLIIVITTADEGDEHSIYAEWHGRAEQQHNRVGREPAFYGVVWCAPDDADPFDIATIRSANPAYGTALNPDVVAAEVEKARTQPSFLPTYKRLRLNIRAKSTAGLITMSDWSALECVQMHPDLTGRECLGGFDLSSTTDFTAAGLLFPPEDPEDPTSMWDVLVHCWIPEDRVESLSRLCRVPLDQWRRMGHLTATEGDVVDYRPLKDWLVQAADTYQLAWVGYDRWNAGDTANELTDAGLLLEPVGQGYASLSSPTKQLDRLVRQHRIRHAGNPLLRWMADSLHVKRDDNDNVRPVKPDRERSNKRIDGMVTLIIGLFGWQHYGATAPSAYSDGYWDDEEHTA
jgi:phage terminase large subunit-like protein